MPTTLISANLNARQVINRGENGTGPLFALACIAVLVLAAAAIFTLPIAVTTQLADPTWLMGP